MSGYVARKESVRIFTTDREKQGGKSLVRGRKHKEGGKEPVSDLIREFRGEIVSSNKMILYPLVN